MATFIPSEEELAVIKRAISLAREDAEKQREVRAKNLNAYYRLPFGNEKDGRSRVVDSAVFNHISGVHPHLMRRFLATDQRIGVKGDDEKIAKGLKRACRDDIHEQGGYELIDDVLKDGEICDNGTAKLWWSRVWGPAEKREKEVTAEELQALAQDVQFEFGPEDVVKLPQRTATVDDQMGTTFVVQGAQMFRVSLTYRPLLESGPVLVSLPPEEFIVARGKARMNDRKGCGHVRKMFVGELQRENERLSMDGAPYYQNIKEAVEAGVQSALTTEEQARRDRESLFFTDAPLNTLTDDDLRREIEVIEWYDCAVRGGRLVPAIFTLGNGVLLRCEENEDGIVAMSTWTPIPSPHSVIGQSLASLHTDDQNVRTTLLRALMDHVAESVDVPMFVRNRNVDLLGLMNRKPGQVIVGNPEDVVPMAQGTLDYRLFQVLEYLKGEGEERGPSTRFNQGVDNPNANNTATGISIVQRASFSKIDLIAMAFSELFLVDLYNKLIILYQKNLDKPRTVVVDGEKVELTRENIQGRYLAQADLGIEVDFDDRAFAKSQMLIQMCLGVAGSGAFQFSAEAFEQLLKDAFLAAGKDDPSKYLQRAQQPAADPAAMLPALLGAGGAPGAAPASPAGAPTSGGLEPTAFGGDRTVEGGAENPGAGMGVGQ